MARAYHRSVTTPAAARNARPGQHAFVSLLTDFGARDPSAGICRAVVAGIAPEATIVDISHEVHKYAIRDGALLLWCAVPYVPIGAHVAVVDPGVGTERSPIAIETMRGDFLVGPDNGILVPAATRLGGIVRVHRLDNPQYRLPIVSTSFHGRDIFSPAAAHLALGVPLEFMGPALDPRGLVLLDWPEPEVYNGLLRTSVIYIDTFGNVKLSALGGHLLNAFGGLRSGEPLWLRMEGGPEPRDIQVPWATTFGVVAPGQALLYEDSYGRLCLATNVGNAARELGIALDQPMTLTRSPQPRPVRYQPLAAPIEVLPSTPEPLRELAPEPEPEEPEPEEPEPEEPEPGAEPVKPGPKPDEPESEAWPAADRAPEPDSESAPEPEPAPWPAADLAPDVDVAPGADPEPATDETATDETPTDAADTSTSSRRGRRRSSGGAETDS